MKARFAWRLALIALTGCLAQAADAFDGPLVKRTHSMASYTTVGGKTLHNVRVGYESYGALSERADNAILVTHVFSGTSQPSG